MLNIGESSRRQQPRQSRAVAAQPTTPPSRRSADEPHHVRIPAAELEQRALAGDEQILGPYWAHDMDEVTQLKRQVQRIRMNKRQTSDQERCFVGNGQLSCYPTANTTVVQNTWSRFIWNANYPLFIAKGAVDVYLFQEDTDNMVTSWTSQDNGANRLSFQPNDSWWMNRTAADYIQPNQNISWPFYFVVMPAGDALTGTTSRLATFTAIQTTLPFLVASSRSAAAAASASSAAAASTMSATTPASATNTGAIASAVQSSLSAALVSSLRASGLSGTETAQATTTATLANGSLVTATATAQANGGRLGGNSSSDNNSNGLALPTYAIVLIAVLGFLAILAAGFGTYFGMAALRKRRQGNNGNESHRSSSPMMAAVGGSVSGISSSDAGCERSHMLPAGAVAARGAGSGRYSDDQPFTTDEASRMADAFRNALRDPQFSPTLSGAASPNEDSGGSNTKRASALLRDELAAEGKDLRSVDHRKTPTWHDEP